MSATRTMAPLAVVVVLMCSSAPIALARVLPVHHEASDYTMNISALSAF